MRSVFTPEGVTLNFMYNWRKMPDEEKAELLRARKARKVAWHAPPHYEYEGNVRFIITAACFEHKPVIGKSPERMADFESELIGVCRDFEIKLFAWCVLPNHYHLLVQTDKIREFQNEGLGKIHGRTSYLWNGQDNSSGRKVWYKSFERPMKSNRHFWASLNYIHHNPIKHGYVSRWQDWVYSSANNYLENIGKEKNRQNLARISNFRLR
jgi:putative transposase